ncbi:condensin complex protein MksE [Chryseobacterium sp. EZn1]|uniref:condensin complex protein MksE n=1 Tax=Chryseobacterium cupriresistens TaxID=3366770 RepID=UPI0039852255
MENENYEISDYSFLSEEGVEKHFADINILLLSGKHIDHKYYAEYTVLESYESQWINFYSNLYRLNLVADISDRSRYYYLDFTENGKGKLSDTNRNKELTELQTLMGLTLLDMYYQKYFDEEKVIHWNDIKTQILESDHQEAYKRVLFNDIRDSYDEREWSIVENKFGKTIDSFDKLGWVEKQSGRNEELVFEIRPAIHRLTKLYQDELQDFESFIQQLKNDEML